MLVEIHNDGPAILILTVAFNPDIANPALGYVATCAFSAGLAAVLIAVGLAVVKGRTVFRSGSGKGLFKRLDPGKELFRDLDAFLYHGAKLIPYVSVLAIVLLGSVMVRYGLSQLRIL